MSPDLGRRRFLLRAGAALAAFGHALAPTRARPSTTPLIARRVLFGDLDRSSPRISPDGRRIAFLSPLDGVLNLWVGPLDDVARARPVTRVTDRSMGPQIVWLHDNRHVVFFRERGGDENWQAHRVDLHTGDVRALAPGPGVLSHVQQRSRHFPGELLIGHNQRDARFLDLYRVDVATGASRLVEHNDGFAAYVSDRRLRVRLGIRATDDGGVDYLLRRDGGWQLFAHIGAADTVTTAPLGFSDDGRVLYWLDARGRDTVAVVGQDPDTGARHIVAEDARADCVGVVHDPRSYRPVAMKIIVARTRWRAIAPAYVDDYARLARLSPGDLVDVSASDDDRHWLASYEHDTGSAQFFHYDRATRRGRRLFTSRPILAAAPLVPMESHVVRARDGLALVCYLSRPRDAGARLPMVLAVHGGPWARDTWGFSFTHQWLANRGYAVLSVNFRGSTGFGKAFVNAADLEWAGKMHEDLIDAIDWAVAQGIADPARIAIYGHSYGGYAALVGLTFTPERFACAVDAFGISNLVTFLRGVPSYLTPWLAIARTRIGDDTTETGKRLLWERSPLSRVDRIVRPLLIAQGANDVRVKPSESDQIVAAMQARGIPVTYVSYSDEGHGFRRPENRRSFAAVVELFLATHLGGRHEPVGEDFRGSTIEFKAGRELIAGLG
jgi:dipeptidyl aminopeptidase/acylaminoacyl peptidase